MMDEISPEQHIADHTAWRAIEPDLRAFLEERRRARDRWERVRTQVVGGLILAVFSAVGSALWWVGSQALAAAGRAGHGP